MKISTARLKQIIKEELFYREFYRGPQELEEAEEKHDHQAALKVVSRDGKKKGVKVSGTWKSGKIKVKWMGEKGIHTVDRPDYTRKNW